MSTTEALTLDTGEGVEHVGGRVALHRQHLLVAEAVVGFSVHAEIRVLDGANSHNLRHSSQLLFVGLLVNTPSGDTWTDASDRVKPLRAKKFSCEKYAKPFRVRV